MPSDLRYKDKPLLRLLECYVLRAIEALPPKDARLLEEVTPKFQQIYHLEGNWWEIIEKVMDLPPTMSTKIRQSWTENVAIGEKAHLSEGAQRFAEEFVDELLKR